VRRDVGAEDEAPRPSQASRRHKLPVALPTFVGRERELSEVQRLLTKARLLMLTGPGGGKTRLVIEAAPRVAQTEGAVSSHMALSGGVPT